MLHRVVLVLILLTSFASAQKKNAAPAPAPVAADPSNRLPVTRVVLYKNGVGYFEHSARIRGTQELNIDFTTAQLNDVLKSLTVVDLGEGRISSVRYNSIAPLSVRLKGLRLPFGEQIGREDFLSALRGSRVEVRSGNTTAAGKLLSLDKTKRQTAKGDVVETTEFSIVTDSGEMRNFELGPGTSVRVVDRELNDEIGRYLNLLGSSRARDLRRMTLTASGAGEREVLVSYISEVPIWKSTYRIILPAEDTAKPVLQGWAIVDNTIGEDWKDVHLSLVAGAPQSFIQEISQPFYARRPVVALPETVQLTPQSHEATMEIAPGGVGGVMAAHATTSLEGVATDISGAVVAGARVTVRNEETGISQTTTTDRKGHYSFSDVQAGNSALSIAQTGYQRFDLTNIYLGVGRNNEIVARLQVAAANEAVEVNATTMRVETTSTSVSSIAANQSSEAEGKSAGDFFQYDIKQTITVGKNQSALVPILRSPLEAEKVTLLSPESAPLRALWVKNTSGQTLDAGTFSVLDAETFAGEGVLETIHPNERRLLSYAGDSGVRLKTSNEQTEMPYTHAKIAKGILSLVKGTHRSRKYIIRNVDAATRQVIVEHPVEEGWKLSPGSPKPEETTANFLRFRVPVAAGMTSELLADEVKPEEAHYELADLEVDEVRLLVEQKRISPAMQQVFDRILERKLKISGFEEKIQDRDQEAKQINADQTRLRENMKALKGSTEEKALLQRYTRQLNDQEDRLAALRKESTDLKTQRDAAQNELERMVLEINLDESF
jgi:hypothetical protein